MSRCAVKQREHTGDSSRFKIKQAIYLDGLILQLLSTLSEFTRGITKRHVAKWHWLNF